MKKEIKNKVYRPRSKKEVLESIEKGAKEAALFLEGKIELETAKDLLDKWLQ